MPSTFVIDVDVSIWFGLVIVDQNLLSKGLYPKVYTYSTYKLL
jgi:hypothetical protein